MPLNGIRMQVSLQGRHVPLLLRPHWITQWRSAEAACCLIQLLPCLALSCLRLILGEWLHVCSQALCMQEAVGDCGAEVV